MMSAQEKVNLKRKEVIDLYLKEFTQREIADMIQSNQNSVYRIIKQYKDRGIINTRKWGRKSKKVMSVTDFPVFAVFLGTV